MGIMFGLWDYTDVSNFGRISGFFGALHCTCMNAL
jgi:hypothetical protein